MIISAINPIKRASAATEPMTIPAIAPLESPPPPLAGAAAAVVLLDGKVDDVGVAVGIAVEKVMKPVIVGSTTFAHTSSALEL